MLTNADICKSARHEVALEVLPKATFPGYRLSL